MSDENFATTQRFASSGATSFGPLFHSFSDLTLARTKGSCSAPDAILSYWAGWRWIAPILSLGLPLVAPARRAVSHMKAFLHHFTVCDTTSITPPGKKLRSTRACRRRLNKQAHHA